MEVKVESFNIRHICIALLIGVILGAAAIGALFLWPHPKPTTAGPTVNTNPAPNAPNQITQTVTGTGSGHINQTPWIVRPTQAAATPKPTPVTSPWLNQSPGPAVTDPTIEPTPAVNSWSAEVPITGEVTAKFTDKKTGQELGTETKPLTGTATVTGDASGLTVDTKFDSEFRFSVEVPDPPAKKFHLGAVAGAKYDDRFGLIYGGYAQYDLIIKRWKLVDVKAPVRVEWTPGEWKGFVGLELNF